MVKSITKNTFKILNHLKETLRYDTTLNKFCPNIPKYLTRMEIINITKISKQNLTNVLKQKELFLTSSKFENEQYMVTFGMSLNGYQIWKNYWGMYILPNQRKESTPLIKNYYNQFFNSGYIKIKNFEEFDMNFISGVLFGGEFPFEIKVKMKDKYRKDKKEFYKVLGFND